MLYLLYTNILTVLTPNLVVHFYSFIVESYTKNVHLWLLYYCCMYSRENENWSNISYSLPPAWRTVHTENLTSCRTYFFHVIPVIFLNAHQCIFDEKMWVWNVWTEVSCIGSYQHSTQITPRLNCLFILTPVRWLLIRTFNHKTPPGFFIMWQIGQLRCFPTCQFYFLTDTIL